MQQSLQSINDFMSGHKTFYTHCFTSELRSCVKVKVAVLGSTSLISLMVSAYAHKVTLRWNLSPTHPPLVPEFTQTDFCSNFTRCCSIETRVNLLSAMFSSVLPAVSDLYSSSFKKPGSDMDLGIVILLLKETWIWPQFRFCELVLMKFFSFFGSSMFWGFAEQCDNTPF